MVLFAGEGESVYRQRLLQANAAYGNKLEHSFFPSRVEGNSNSNSFASDLLVSVGLPVPQLPVPPLATVFKFREAVLGGSKR